MSWVIMDSQGVLKPIGPFDSSAEAADWASKHFHPWDDMAACKPWIVELCLPSRPWHFKPESEA